MIRADIKEIKKVINDNIDVIAKFKESEKLLHLLEVMSRLIIESDNIGTPLREIINIISITIQDIEASIKNNL